MMTKKVWNISSVAGANAENDSYTMAKQRKPGSFKGKFEVGPEFFKPLNVEDLQEINDVEMTLLGAVTRW